MKRRRFYEQLGFFLGPRLSIVAIAVLLWVIVGDILVNGIGAISWEFLTQPPRMGMTEGGILPAIVGTIAVSMLTIAFSVPLGISAAI